MSDWMDPVKNHWYAVFTALGIPVCEEYRPNGEGRNEACRRYLVLCRGGNTRSVATAFLLKYKYGQDAITGSLEKNATTTLALLKSWAEVVVVTEPEHLERAKLIPPQEKEIYLLNLDGMARLRAHPFDVDFLLQLDQKLQELFNGKP